MSTNVYNVIGLMSGTSLDGLDIAYCRFHKTKERWNYEIVAADTCPYTDEGRKRLSTLEKSNAWEYVKTNVDLGHYFGKRVVAFMTQHDIQHTNIDFIASHGHTIFHQPESGVTTQIAEPNAIASETRIPVVADFRTLDVSLGGQGAPLVPIGDSLLFGDYDSCLNLGGIANISFLENGKRVAFDISPCNMILNYLAQKTNMPYDKGGTMAKSGKPYFNLLEKLNRLEYYSLPHPKSLGKEWFMGNFKQLFDNTNADLHDLLATAVEHISFQIAKTFNDNAIRNSLVTGGGAFNYFLIENIRKKTDCIITIPHSIVVNYKEALVFAFLGVLRMRGESNCLSSVTGARYSNCGGIVSGTF